MTLRMEQGLVQRQFARQPLSSEGRPGALTDTEKRSCVGAWLLDLVFPLKYFGADQATL